MFTIGSLLWEDSPVQILIAPTFTLLGVDEESDADMHLLVGEEVKLAVALMGCKDDSVVAAILAEGFLGRRVNHRDSDCAQVRCNSAFHLFANSVEQELIADNLHEVGLISIILGHEECFAHDRFCCGEVGIFSCAIVH